MALVTLTTLRARTRERADLVGSAFVTDGADSLDSWINEGVARLHEKLVEAYGEEWSSVTSPLTTIAGQTDYALPANFYKLYGVDLNIGGRARTILPYTRLMRGRQRDRIDGWQAQPRYLLTHGSIRFLPAPAATTGTLYYAPIATTLVAPADTVDLLPSWDRYIVLYAAVQALIKEESDHRPLQEQLDRMEAELASIKEQRDLAAPKQAVDMDEVNFYEVF